MKETDADITDERPVVTTIERYAGSPDLCTIHLERPDRDPTDESMTAWLSAEEGSYCSVGANR